MKDRHQRGTVGRGRTEPRETDQERRGRKYSREIDKCTDAGKGPGLQKVQGTAESIER